ncbi:MAG: YfhO family protein [Firmicutes bacterium]|nr:YfhO family protein [Bacillota bacterium]
MEDEQVKVPEEGTVQTVTKKKKQPLNEDWFGICNGRHILFKSFMLALITSIVMFLPAIIWDQGYFLFLGDFNSQQVPFYKLAHSAVRSGNLGWNWYTDLGANFIGSYTFYLLGSPFFWLTLPFPNDWVPYLMGPLLMLKYATMSMTATAWLRRYVKHSEYAILGGLLYAFSGYTMYNTFFNHFLDVMAFFPLMLIGMDELVENNTRGVFALAVAINAIINYVFFAGEAVFMILYFFVKVWMGGYKTTFKRFIAVGVEAILGFMISAFLVLPSLIVMLDNPRSSGFLTGYDFWIYDYERKPWVILLNFFFPPELPSQPIFITNSYMRWTSVQAYIPVLSMCGVIAFLREKRRHWLKHFIILLFIMAFIPGLNSMFTMMNDSYYARWYFMFVLILILATVMTLEQGDQQELMDGFKITTVFTVIVILAMVLTPEMETVTNEVPVQITDSAGNVTVEMEEVEEEVIELGIFNETFTVPFVIMCLTCLVSAYGLYYIFQHRQLRPKLFANYLLIAVCLFGMIYGNYYVVYGKTRSYDTKNYIIPDAIQGQDKIYFPEEDRDRFFRIDNDDSFINMGMFWEVPDMHAFHSIVPVSIMDFYEYIGDERDVNSKMDYKRYASRSLFSVKYFCDRIDYRSDIFGDPTEENPETKMPGYTYLYDMAGFAVWENENYIPMGFTYDVFIRQSVVDQMGVNNRDELMLKALILSDEQAEKYGDLMLEASSERSFSYTYEKFVEDCDERAAESAYYFSYDNTGFTAKIELESDNLVFFSVPYEEGWTAEVNGEPVEVEKVQIGFMAVKAQAGDNTIRFYYNTPGLKAGIAISVCGCMILAAYWIGSEMYKKKVAV